MPTTTNRQQRRALAKAVRRGPKHLAEDVCQVCAFISSTIIGPRANDFTLADGTLVELGVNRRLEPPLGIRFPKSAAKRQKCIVCAGVGKFGCTACKGSGHKLLQQDQPCETCQGQGKVACEKCAGFGFNWTRNDFAPACTLCSQFIMVWLKEREDKALMLASPVTGPPKIILPSQQQASRLSKGIILPGQ